MSHFSRARKLSLTAAIAGAVAVVVVLVSLAPAGTAPADARPRVAGLTGLGSCGKLRGYVAKHRSAYGIRTGDVAPPFTGAEGTAPVADDAGGAAPVAPDPSSPTNVQEAGVDEPDTVKTAGSTIFTVDGSTLRAVDTAGDTPVAAGTLELPNGAGDDMSVGSYQLLVAGDRLLAIGSSYGYAIPFADSGSGADGVAVPDIAYPSEPRIWIVEVDISDPASMSMLRTEKVDGSFISARLTGSTVRLVTSHYPSGPLPEAGKGRKLLPRVTVRDHTTRKTRRGRLGGCASVSHPSRFSGAGTLSVMTVDLARGLPAVDVDSVLTDGHIVYASTGALYVSTERWLDPEQPYSPSSDVITEIHRFDISDPDQTAYTSSGSVDGYMLSQWSMSESEGILRVASTTSPPFDPTGEQQEESESYVTALATAGDRLTRVGRVGGLGRGEQIYAVRFIGDVGYVVTFRQVDPLYTLDLSDPTAPRVVGELKIPGYSAYLHPVGEGLLLGVGQDADSSGRTTGLQASLFDVSDPANPVRVDQETFGSGSSSEVEYDHHAFSWFTDHGLALFPVESYGPSSEFHGAVGLRVTPGSADALGRVAKISRGTSYEDAIRRSLELGGRIYTVAATGIDAYDPATMTRWARWTTDLLKRRPGLAPEHRRARDHGVAEALAQLVDGGVQPLGSPFGPEFELLAGSGRLDVGHRDPDQGEPSAADRRSRLGEQGLRREHDRRAR